MAATGRRCATVVVPIQAGCAMLTDVKAEQADDLLRALGRVVLEASYLERALMAAFAALLGSKYAPVVDSHRVIHDAWALRPGGEMVTPQPSGDTADVAGTLPELRQVADELGNAANHLTAAVTAAFGTEAMRVEDQLRLDLSRDVTADPGR